MTAGKMMPFENEEIENPHRRVEDRWQLEVRAQVQRLQQARIAVLGDIMVDRFIWGRVSRISPEAPVPVVDVDRRRTADGHRLGGAANVAHNVVHLGARALLYGVVGNDDTNRVLWQLLASRGIDGRGVHAVPDRATTLKTRIVAQGQQVVRFDVEDRGALPDTVVSGIYDTVLKGAEHFDALIISDYAKGVVDRERLPALIAALRAQGKVVAVDPKVLNFNAYTGATVVTPNHLEACQAAGIPAEPLDATSQAARFWLERLSCDAVLVTLGEDGMLMARTDVPDVRIPARAVEVFDVTGAGDTVIAVLTMALAVGNDWESAIQLANVAAGVAVGKVGTSVVSAFELEHGRLAT